MSTRRSSTQLQLSRKSIQRILAKLRFFLYKLQPVQGLQPTDYRQRILQLLFGKKPMKIKFYRGTHNGKANFSLNAFINKLN